MAKIDDLEFMVIDKRCKTEEQDRSLSLEIVWPSESHDIKLLDDETLPDFTSGDESVCHSARISHSATKELKARINTSDQIQKNILTENPKPLTRFLSKSHNSLVSRPVDYSKIESKVKQYIVNMKEQQENRRQRGQTPSPSKQCRQLLSSRGCSREPESFIEPTENVEDLKRQLAEQATKVEVLQEDHDRLFLQNARLLNIIDEMRFKLYGQHSSKSERRTNSPGDYANDNKYSLDSAISLPTNIERESMVGYDAGSLSFRSAAGSVNSDLKQVSRSYRFANRSFAEVEATCKRLVFDSSSTKFNKNSLLRQLQEATTLALSLRDQTRTLVQTMDKIKQQ